MSDPNMHWDGNRWLRWNGTEWVPVEGTAPIPAGGDRGAPRRSATVWIIAGIAGGLTLLLIAGAVLTWVLVSRGNRTEPLPVPTPTPSGSSATPVNPTVIETLRFLKPQPDGTTYAIAVMTRGSQISGWAGTLRSGEIHCFNGTITGNTAGGTLVTPREGELAPLTQPFEWQVTGSGRDLRIVKAGTITNPTPASVPRFDQAAGQNLDHLFETCAALTGGLK